MELRWILYGYAIENDVYSVVASEAETVKRIFLSYANGMTLKAIADSLTAERVAYNKEKNQWSKNMIARIIENVPACDTGIFRK